MLHVRFVQLLFCLIDFFFTLQKYECVSCITSVFLILYHDIIFCYLKFREDLCDFLLGCVPRKAPDLGNAMTVLFSDKGLQVYVFWHRWAIICQSFHQALTGPQTSAILRTYVVSARCTCGLCSVPATPALHLLPPSGSQRDRRHAHFCFHFRKRGTWPSPEPLHSSWKTSWCLKESSCKAGHAIWGKRSPQAQLDEISQLAALTLDICQHELGLADLAHPEVAGWHAKQSLSSHQKAEGS